IGLHASTVQNAKRICCSRVIDFCEDLSNFGVHLGSDFRGGRTPGADRPYRLVSDNDMGKRGIGQPAQPVTNLSAHHINGPSGIAFREGFPHTYDCFQSAAYRGKRLLFDGFVGLPEMLAALRVANDRIGASCLDKHPDGNLAGKSAFFFPMYILSRDCDTRTVGFINGGRKRGEGRSDDDVAVFHVLDSGNQSIKKRARLGPRFEHFPIPRDDGPPHSPKLLSVSTSTPGSFCPDKNSKAAPPRVEICVILDPPPDCATAAAESPPPTIE